MDRPMRLRGLEIHIVKPDKWRSSGKQGFHMDNEALGKNYYTVAYELTHSDDPSVMTEHARYEGSRLRAYKPFEAGYEVEAPAFGDIRIRRPDTPWSMHAGDGVHRGRPNRSGRVRVVLFFVFSTELDDNFQMTMDEVEAMPAKRRKALDVLMEAGDFQFKGKVMDAVRYSTTYKNRGKRRYVFVLEPTTTLQMFGRLAREAERRLPRSPTFISFV